ncbi:valine--tRNA ligase [Candidatus Berkiella aquae]|uniref:Valine--tRNA ligase n=1 Tax=Candidatus Berkiella aquae TaxID=295108 RepID=A0AAE3HWG8_9GAMM|nr:valine--tRNA ligase [Candidatus Berkiella aquae]MCS5711006.1 valine--tRNA ligase [Candidatus Berkiella aquae]
MDKTYHPLEIEKRWYHHWNQTGYFKPSEGTQAYCIMLPPPNVTGTLHMGHAFQDTIMDALIRYHRMLGYKTLWQGGTDHAGIATQMVVERQLNAQGINKHDIGREAFIQKVWEWKDHSGNTICKQMHRLGASVDWSRERFTMDQGLSDAVKEVFVRLYDEKLIYRGQRLVNWDPKLHTAVSDLEVISQEEAGNLWHIRYPIENSNQHLIVATTRPETLLGDVAVAVHPDDERYQSLIGKKVKLPLTDRLIPIIADSFVDPEFGTGCVKITPAHDFNDYEVGKRHQLPMINIFTEDAIINTNAPERFQNLPRFTARERIVAELEQANLFEKVEPHTLKVPRSERTGEIIEPYLTDQWFVDAKTLAVDAIKVVKEGKIEFVPENWTKTYYEWMENIQDWCISRQIWWGHRIPAWYDANNNVYVARSEAEVRQKYGLSADLPLMQDNDVLDTWFSSALWPFSTLGWPHETPELKSFYPTSVLVTGFDILFFWVARMIMMGLKFRKEVPFKKVFIHGLIQDSEGQKMSKSKGNIIDPIDLIDGIDLEKLVAKRTYGLMQPGMAKKIEQTTRKHFPEGIPSYGTDALRFTFCAIATTGRHIRFDLGRIEGYRNFCNKLWNAARYVQMNVEGKELGKHAIDREFTLCDQWIWSIWQQTKQTIKQHFDDYRFDLLSQTLYEFTWNQYCDWYLELSKPTLTKEGVDEKLQRGTRYTLVAILEELLRTIHPIMPFITEEIWQKMNHFINPSHQADSGQSIMLQPYPLFDASKVNHSAEVAMQGIQAMILGVRNIRGEMNISPAKQLPLLCRGGDASGLRKIATDNLTTVQSLCKVENLSWLEANATVPSSATALVNDLELFIPLAGFIDKEAEAKRLNKEMEKLHKEITDIQKRLQNENYVKKAPADVVAKEREKLQVAEKSLEKFQDNLAKIQAL